MSVTLGILRGSLANIAVFFLGIAGVWVLLFVLFRREDFAGLIVGFASIPMVLALAKGTLQHWRLRRPELDADLDTALRLTRQASWVALVIAIVGAAGLAAAMPGTWTSWALGLAWGCYGGITFFVVFRRLNRELGASQAQ